jgi:cytoskeletal protein CcmA (bactofilin family)
MKTKLSIVIFFTFFITSISLAQNTGGSENPDSLSFTFADTTQNLQVNGSMVVDSSLTVKDSVVMEDNLHIYEKLQLEKDAHLKKDVYVGNEIKVEGDVYLMKNVYVQENLKVEGNTILQKNATIRKKLNVEGNAIFEKNALIEKELKVNGESNLVGIATFYNKINFLNISDIDPLSFNNIEDSTNQNIVPKILFVDQNGEVQKGEDEVLKSLIYQPKLCNEPIAGILNYSPTWANGPNKIFLAECPSAAKVGIGTSNPSHKLHTVGDVLFTGTLQVGKNVGIGGLPSTFSMLKVNNPAAATGIEVDMSNNTVDYQKLLYMKYAHEETELIKIENASTGHIPFILESSGRLVISNETEKILQLEPSGLLRARRIRVDSDTWADFVFDKNYKLMSLNELEQYVVTENHLPNVPSAQDVIQNGVDLVEMNKILLQKVEELTLYLMDQNKQVQEQKSRIEELEKTIKN